MNIKDLSMVNQSVIGLLEPLIDIIVDRVSERILSATDRKEPKFYTRKETAELLHITLPTLARLTKDGFITSKHVGNRILYEANAIDEAVKKQTVFKYRKAL
jgi:excisionase family DNA binding protein